MCEGGGGRGRGGWETGGGERDCLVHCLTCLAGENLIWRMKKNERVSHFFLVRGGSGGEYLLIGLEGCCLAASQIGGLLACYNCMLGDFCYGCLR